MDPPFEEKEWAGKIRAGDPVAFEALFRTYHDALCAFVQRQVGSPEVAEDLVQDIFLDLWHRRWDWKLRGTLKAYLYGAARNKVIKHWEHRSIRRQWERREKRREAPTGSTPEDRLQRREIECAMQASIAELPERRRLVYVLSRQHGLTYKEIAAALDISPNTVENQMVRALKFLRERLSAFLSALI